ncbi:hypothetical protein PRUB_a5193 [Pseudoalteromonas rubra]|uniref:Uncharacterized protein n=1 Tax=Pseudoalteromonas rubra TaxID=43658 RepID=A0A8T0CAK1_9GAMM|nr:hypothetical protein PRUB_a5193 [Pseudoalteromonas rubra]
MHSALISVAVIVPGSPLKARFISMQNFNAQPYNKKCMKIRREFEAQ